MGGLGLPKWTRNWWVGNNILWRPPRQGRNVLARTASHPDQRWGGDKDCVQDQCRGNESCKERLRERERDGEDLDRVPGFWLLEPQICWQGVLQSVTEKVKCLMLFPRVSLDSSPPASSHSWVYITEPKGHIFEKKKKNKNKPCCSLRREEGAEGCWGLSHVGPCSVKATSQQQHGTVLGESLTFCHPCFNVLYSPFKSCQFLV